MTNAALARKMMLYTKEAKDGNANWRERAKENYRFYVGDQWTSADKEKLKAEGRPYLTLNNILPIINAISGNERSNRKVALAYPKKGGTAKIAKLFSSVCRHVYDQTNFIYEVSQAFVDGIVCGKGWWNCEIDFEEDPIDGDVKISRLSPFDIEEDPNSNTYDLNKSANYIVRHFWWDRETLELAYPKQKANIEDAVEWMAANTGDVKSFEATDSEEGTYRDNDGTTLRTTKYKIDEIFWKSFEKRSFIINTKTLDLQRVDPTQLEIAEKLAKKDPSLKIIERIVPILHQTIMLGRNILESNDDPYNGIAKFPLFRFTPYYVEKLAFGVVDNLKDPQQEINKRSSQALHHLNQTANSGWLGEDGWEVEDKEEVEAFGSKAGASIHFRSGKKPERIMPAPLSQGHLLLARMGVDQIKMISGINADLLGYDKTKSESGVAMQSRREQGLVVSNSIFDNFDYTQQIFGEMLLEIIRKTNVFSDQEIILIAKEQKESEEEFQQILASRSSWAIGRYGIKVIQSSASITERTARFEQLTQMARGGMPIPPEVIFESSDLPNKDEIIKNIKQQQQAAAQAAQEELNMKKQKQEQDFAIAQAEIQIKQGELQIKQAELQLKAQAQAGGIKNESR